jgi:LacI family transcriptional regulator
LKSLADRQVDGIAVIPSAHSRAALESLRGSGLPIILLDRRIDGLNADAVLVDNEGGARAAAAALIADGFKRIGFLGGPMEVSTAAERFRGYERALRDGGVARDPGFEAFAGLDIASGYRMMEEMAMRPERPDAFFIVNSFVHVGATNYLLSKGAPGIDRIVFASFDETDYSPLLRFCRYSVAQPIGDIGAAAARLLLGRIGGQGGEGPRTEVLETRLVRHGAGKKEAGLLFSASGT